MSDAELRAAFRQAVERVQQAPEPEEEGGSVPLVEVHRTPSTGSWLGMVRRRIAGGAGEDGEGSGGMVREFSLPKQRRSGQGGTLKAVLAVVTALLVWLTGLKILDQPRFSHTRGHAYAVRTLDTLYDVSTGLPYVAADAARFMAARTSAGLADAAAHPAAAQFAATLTSAGRRLLAVVADADEEPPADAPGGEDQEPEQPVSCADNGHSTDCSRLASGGADLGSEPLVQNPSLLSTWRRRLTQLIGGSQFAPLGGGARSGQVAVPKNALLTPSGTVFTQATGNAAGASNTLDSGTPAVPLGFGVGARVGSMPGGMNVPPANTTTGTTPYVAGVAAATTSAAAGAQQAFVSPSIASALTAGGISGSTASAGAARGASPASPGVVPGVAAGGAGAGQVTGGTGQVTGASGAGQVGGATGISAGGSTAQATSTSASTVSQGAPNERPALLAPATPAPVAAGMSANPAQPQAAVANATPGPFSQMVAAGLAGGTKSGMVSMKGPVAGGSSVAGGGAAGSTGAGSGTPIDAFIPGRRLLRH